MRFERPTPGWSSQPFGQRSFQPTTPSLCGPGGRYLSRSTLSYSIVYRIIVRVRLLSTPPREAIRAIAYGLRHPPGCHSEERRKRSGWSDKESPSHKPKAETIRSLRSLRMTNPTMSPQVRSPWRADWVAVEICLTRPRVIQSLQSVGCRSYGAVDDAPRLTSLSFAS